MALLRVTNTTALAVTVQDVGVLIAALSSDDFTNPNFIRDLATSQDLRTLVLAGTLTLSDGTNPVTISDLLQYWQSAGYRYPLNEADSNRRYWQIQQNGGLTTVDNSGFTTAPTATGGATLLNTPTGQFISYASPVAAASEAGWIAAIFNQTQFNYRPFYKCAMRVGVVISDVRYWFGFFSATPMAASDPAINGMGFRYSTDVDGTAFWRCWSNDGVLGGTVTVTAVPFVAGTSYTLSIELSPDGTAIFFYINDVLVATHTTDLPGAAVNLGHVERIATLAGGSKSVAISKVVVSQRLM
jgi:hypothetical protein